MKKKHVSLLLAIIMLLMAVPMTGYANSVLAEKNVTKIFVDGEYIYLNTYYINNYTYFKLRDIAYLLSGTDKQFDVTWDGSKKTVKLIKGKDYTAVGDELKNGPIYARAYIAVPNASTILLDNKEIKLTSYTIEGYNYFKLRDLANIFNFYVGWDSRSNTVLIESMFDFVPENSGNSYSYVSNVDIDDTQADGIRNWARVSSVQQFSYMDEGLAYAYVTDNQLKIVTPGKTLNLEMKYPLLGDVISDDAGNFYIVWGREGTNSTDETIFISKYSPNGVHIRTTGFTGETSTSGEYNTKIPFDAGNCTSAIHDGLLVVNYARTMYSGHQSNTAMAVNTEDMSQYKFNIPYVSHSFNQSVIYSELADNFVFANHGDAYDRGFIVQTMSRISYYDYDEHIFKPIYPAHNIFHFYLEPRSNYNMFVVNKTFAQLGGLAETSKGVVLVGASAKSIGEEAKKEKQNLFIQIFNPLSDELSPSMFVGGSTRSGKTSLDIFDKGDSPLSEVTDYGVIWLTNNTDKDVIAPQVVVGDDRIIILWNEMYVDEVEYYYGSETFYMVLSSDGKVITPATSLGYLNLNSYEMPVFHNGSVYWACAYNGIIRVISIPINE